MNAHTTTIDDLIAAGFGNPSEALNPWRTHAGLMTTAAEAEVHLSRGHMITEYERAALKYRKQLTRRTA